MGLRLHVYTCICTYTHINTYTYPIEREREEGEDSPYGSMKIKIMCMMDFVWLFPRCPPACVTFFVYMQERANLQFQFRIISSGLSLSLCTHVCVYACVLCMHMLLPSCPVSYPYKRQLASPHIGANRSN
jgi:hypothetical protein